MSNERLFPPDLADVPVHLVGIKGTGMCALAEFLVHRGARVTGSDTGEVFYTDALLRRIGIEPAVGFYARNIPADCTAVVHSQAYSRESNPELQEALRRRIPVATYPEALGALSSEYVSVGIAGVHGKTTTTAMAGTAARAVGLPVTVIVGSSVPSLGGSSTLVAGDEILIAETCEYRRGFLAYSPTIVVVTSVELDHPDYFTDYRDIKSAFVEFAGRISRHGALVYCADDCGASEVASEAVVRRPDLQLVPYGFTAPGPFGLTDTNIGGGLLQFQLRGYDVPFELAVPGRHNALNATAVVAVIAELHKRSGRNMGDAEIRACREGLKRFTGSRRRSQVVGESGGVLIVDDYAHHPTAIRATLSGYKQFFGGRRLVVDFMPHTYTRTAALFDEFSHAFRDADVVVLHEIYSSARESAGDVCGMDLFEAVKRNGVESHFVPSPADAVDLCMDLLRPGDIFLTMGAGDNWKLGETVLARLSEVRP